MLIVNCTRQDIPNNKLSSFWSTGLFSEIKITILKFILHVTTWRNKTADIEGCSSRSFVKFCICMHLLSIQYNIHQDGVCVSICLFIIKWVGPTQNSSNVGELILPPIFIDIHAWADNSVFRYYYLVFIMKITVFFFINTHIRY